MTEVDVGTRIGNYILKKRLGRGQFGIVFQAEHYRNPRIQVAVKVFDPVGCASVEERELALVVLEKEAESLHALQHPGIVAFHDLVIEASVQAVILEYLDGCDLKAELREKGLLPPHEVIDILEQVLEALACAHDRGIIHRDLKPANIFHCSDGRFKIVDFGMARCTDGSQGSRTHGLKGSPWYLAPEQLYERVLPASDLYALGITAWELLAGRNPCPYNSTAALLNWILNEPIPDLREHAPDVPSWLVELIRRFTMKDERSRPRDGRSALEAFRALKATSGEAQTASAPRPRPLPLVLLPEGELPSSEASPAAGETIIPLGEPALGNASLIPVLTASAEESADDIELAMESQVQEAPLRKGLSRGRKLLVAVLAAVALGLPGVLLLRMGGEEPGEPLQPDLPMTPETESSLAPASAEPLLEAEPSPGPQPSSATLPSRPSSERRADNRRAPVEEPAARSATVETPVETGTVSVKGVQSALLRGSSGSFSPGQVPQGTYDLSVLFQDGRRIERPGFVVVKAGQSTVIRCDASVQNCR